MHFADASALVSRYVQEPRSAKARRLLEEAPIAVSRLSEVEVVSAFARLCREDRLSRRARDRAIAAFTADLTSWYVVEVTATIAASARRLLIRRALRSGDAIQLASALWLQQAAGEPLESVLAFDERLIAAARAEHLPITGPPR
jgi:predicted nucleic acid-binding protein